LWPEEVSAVKRLVTCAFAGVVTLATVAPSAFNAREAAQSANSKALLYADFEKLELTSINLTAFCDQCDTNKAGMVIVDNMVFEK
jgi:hypothetical protein